jgi:hypothetical protein
MVPMKISACGSIPITDSNRSQPTKGCLARLPVVMAFIFLIAAGLSGCTAKLIGDYDDTFDQDITAVEQKTELYLARLQSTPNTAFDQSFYDDITSRLAVLKTRATALPKYDILIEQIKNLQSQMVDFETLDKSSVRPISPAVVNDAKTELEVSFESIIKLELALKRTGTTPSAALAPGSSK